MASRLLQRAAKHSVRLGSLRAAAAVAPPVYGNPTRASALCPPAAGQRSMATTVTVEKPDTLVVYPRENPGAGLSYELNWSLCGSGVVPQGNSFRNLKAQDLSKAGGSKKADVPQVVPWSSAIEQEVQNYLGSAKITRYVQDSALGALLSNEVQVRLVSDSAAAALDFKTWLSTARSTRVSDYQEDVTVLAAVDLTTKGPFISYNPKTKTILIGGTSNFEKLLDFFPQASTEAFLERKTLPLWGSLVGDTLIASKGFDAKASIKHGCALSASGFCRLFMGSISEGKVKDEYKAFPNSLPLPKAVVLFANDATGTIPGASKLSAAQAAYFLAAGVVPLPGLTSFSKAANIALEVGESTPLYLVNRAAFTDAAAADEAALALAGKPGAAGALGLQVVETGKTTKKGTPEDAAKLVKAWQTAVEARCKGIDAVLAGAPKL